MQRNGGSQRCQHQQYVKHEREDIAHPRYTLESQLEHIGQSDKHQSRTGIGRQPRNGIDCRKNDETGQHGHERVYQRHASGCLYQIGITRKIGSIRTKTSHADTHGKESLPHGIEHHLTVYLTEIGTQQESQPLGRTGHGEGTNHQDTNNQQQQWHHNFGELLYTVFHTPNDNDMRKQDESRHIEYRFPRTTHKIIEEKRIVLTLRKAPRSRSDHILQRPPGHYAIISQDKKSSRYSHHTDPFPMCARCQHFVCSSRIGPRTATDKKLGNHYRYAQKHHTQDINQNKSSPTVLAHFARKTPNVSQSDSRPSRSQYNPDLTSKIHSFIRRHKPFLKY